MSHLSRVKDIKFVNRQALEKAARAVDAVVRDGVGKMYGNRRLTGICIDLPGWRHPVVINDKGEAQYDAYGTPVEQRGALDQFTQGYSFHLVADEAAKRGLKLEIIPSDPATADGRIRVRVGAPDVGGAAAGAAAGGGFASGGF